MADTLWTTETPATLDASDASPGLTLGTAFYVTQTRTCIGIQWRFPTTTPVSAVTGQLWSNYSYGGGTETLAASCTFAGTEAGGFFTALFSSSVVLTANTVYVASIHTPDRYVASGSIFGSAVTNGDIVGVADGSNPFALGTVANGVFDQSASTNFPSGTFNHSSYFVGPFLQSLGTEGYWGSSL